MVVNVCKGNPNIMVEPAVAIAIKSLNGAAQNADTPIVDIKNDKYATQVRKGVVVRVQEELAKQKFLPAGSADGDYGPATRDALVAFQKSKGMTQTGIPDPSTIIGLFFSEGK
jgi:peptidoglycan hydrolase-like protein with peptidoglycan-binding domain